MSPAARSAPAGWYPDPQSPGQVRYWDGSSWTQHRHRHPGGGVQRRPSAAAAVAAPAQRPLPRAAAPARTARQTAAEASGRSTALAATGRSKRPSLRAATGRSQGVSARPGAANQATGRRTLRAATKRPSFFEDDEARWYRSDALLLVLALVLVGIVIALLA